MGTNYYLRKNTCPQCGHSNEELHIGKCSFGWTFSFHAYPNIRSWKDWQKELKNGRIFDEYGKEISIKDFITIVNEKKTASSNHAKLYPEGSFLDKEGNSFSEYGFS